MAIIEYLLLALLIVVTLVTRRARARYFTNHSSAYNKLMVSYLSWGLLLLVRVAGENGFFDGILFLEQMAWRYMIEALLLVAGGLFFWVGLAEWFPKVAFADSRTLIRRNYLNLLSSVSDVVRNSESTKHVLEEISRQFMLSLNVADVKFYAWDESSGKLTSVDAKGDTPAADWNLQSWHQPQLHSGRVVVLWEGTSSDTRPAALVPLMERKGTTTVMKITWENHRDIDKETELVLNITTGTVTALCSSLDSRDRQTQSRHAVFTELGRELVNVEYIADAIQLIDSSLRKIVDYDIFRLAVYDARGLNVTQYCVGQDKSLLTERSKSISTSKTHLGQVYNSNEVVYTSDLASSEFDDDLWLATCGVSCSATVPLRAGKRVLGAATFAARNDHLHDQIDKQFAGELTSILLAYIKCDQLSHELVTYNRRILDIGDMLKQMVTVDSNEQLLSEVVNTIVKKLPASYCRLWSYSEEEDKLHFVVDAQVRNLIEQVSETKTVSVRKVRRHREALHSGKIVLLDQDDEQSCMDKNEQTSMLVRGLRSAILVPLLAGEKRVGLLAIAELRSQERRSFTLPETLFVRVMGSVATEVLQNNMRANRFRNLSRRVGKLEQGYTLSDILSDLPSRLATPLTSIMARTEQLLNSQTDLGDDNVRTLGIIKSQVEKITKEIRYIQEVKNEQYLST